MSWMDSWSRPRKSQATPAPLYEVDEGVKYCFACGRVIGSRKSNSAKAATTEVKFCSDRCKRHKLRPVDRRIEAAFTALLDGKDASQYAAVPGETPVPGNTTDAQVSQQDGGKSNNNHHQDGKSAKGGDKKKQKVKGDPRIIVLCSEVETLVFGSRDDPEKTFGRRKNRAARGVQDKGEWKSVDMEGSDTDPGTASTISAGEESYEGGGTGSEGEEGAAINGGGGVKIGGSETPEMIEVKRAMAGQVRPPQSQSAVNGSVGGEKGWAERIEETPEMLQKRREGQRRAEEKEMVKSAARRLVVFGIEREDGARDSKEGKGGKKKDAREGKESDRRMCEAFMNNAVVEPSYAKGDWGIRWREGHSLSH